MFLKEYLNDIYYEEFIKTYNEEFIVTINETIFKKAYFLLKTKGFYFLEDLILKYPDLFMLDTKTLSEILQKAKSRLGDNYIYLVGNDLTLLDEFLDLEE